MNPHGHSDRDSYGYMCAHVRHNLDQNRNAFLLSEWEKVYLDGFWTLVASYKMNTATAEEKRTQVKHMCETETGRCFLLNFWCINITVSGVWEQSQFEYPFNVKAVLKNLLPVYNVS